MRPASISKWDKLNLAWGGPHASSRGQAHGTDVLRCAARIESFELATRQIEDRGTGSPLVRAALAQLGEEYQRRAGYWSARRVSEDHPPAVAFIIGVVGLVLPLVLIASVLLTMPARSDLGGAGRWERLWPVLLMSVPLAVPSGWLLVRALWKGGHWGVLGGLCLSLAVALPVAVARIEVLAPLRGPLVWTIATSLAVVGAWTIWNWLQRGNKREVTLPESIRARICPDCGLRLDTAAPAIKRELMGGVDIGPRSCPRCASPWPLVPPPAGLIDREMTEVEQRSIA